MGTGIGTGKALGIGDTGSLCVASAPPFWATSFSDFLGIPFHSANKLYMNQFRRSGQVVKPFKKRVLCDVYKNEIIKAFFQMRSTQS